MSIDNRELKEMVAVAKYAVPGDGLAYLLEQMLRQIDENQKHTSRSSSYTCRRKKWIISSLTIWTNKQSLRFISKVLIIAVRLYICGNGSQPRTPASIRTFLNKRLGLLQ